MCNTNAINMVGYIYSATILNSSIIKLTNGEINRITINRIMKPNEYEKTHFLYSMVSITQDY